jgi:hypothetical protein
MSKKAINPAKMRSGGLPGSEFCPTVEQATKQNSLFVK